MELTPEVLNFWKLLLAAAPQDLRAAPPPVEPRLTQVRELRFADVLMHLHGYWKSKVFEVHCNWEEVTDKVDVSKLDKREMTEKDFETRKMPTFKLGQRVRIVAEDKRLFKILQKKVGIWREGLANVVGKEAIVMNLSSLFVIGVSLIDSGEMGLIHGYSLEILENHSEEGIWQNKTEFNRDDEVVIGVDNIVLANLQRNARKTPFNVAAQLTRFIGRVVCFFRGEVVVTFDEMRHELFNPAALKLHSDQETEKKKMAPHSTDKDIRLGSKAVVLPNLAEVMVLQRGHGEWHYKMTKFIGKEGTIVNITPNGDLIMNFSPFESYVMNRKALNLERKKGRTRTKSGNGMILNRETPFMPGDVVRLAVALEDLMSILQLLRIPQEFFTIMTDCMEFIGYVDRMVGVVDVGDGAE